MKSIPRIFFKLILVISILVVYLIRSFFWHFLIKDPKARRRKFVANTAWAATLGCRICNIEVVIKNKPLDQKHYLLVGNHMGFLDIWVTASVVPSAFITSYEIKEVPVLGLITEMGGCLYVERRSREGIPNEIKAISSVLDEGFNVVLYPEGTSGNAERILPFKKSLLVAASKSQTDIRPICLNYTHVNGEPFSDKYRDFICWYGDMGFAEGLFRLLSLKSIRAELTFLPELAVSEESCRHGIAAYVQEQIEACFIKIPKPV